MKLEALSATWDDEDHRPPHQDVTVLSGSGCWLVEESGRRLLDAGSGHSCVNLGYANPELMEAAAESYRRLAYCSLEHHCRPVMALSETLSALLGNGYRIRYAATGGGANELAIEIARRFWRHQGRGATLLPGRTRRRQPDPGQKASLCHCGSHHTVPARNGQKVGQARRSGRSCFLPPALEGRDSHVGGQASLRRGAHCTAGAYPTGSGPLQRHRLQRPTPCDPGLFVVRPSTEQGQLTPPAFLIADGLTSIEFRPLSTKSNGGPRP